MEFPEDEFGYRGLREPQGTNRASGRSCDHSGYFCPKLEMTYIAK